jgi:hypothetical protein
VHSEWLPAPSARSRRSSAAFSLVLCAVVVPHAAGLLPPRTAKVERAMCALTLAHYPIRILRLTYIKNRRSIAPLHRESIPLLPALGTARRSR